MFGDVKSVPVHMSRATGQYSERRLRLLSARNLNVATPAYLTADSLRETVGVLEKQSPRSRAYVIDGRPQVMCLQGSLAMQLQNDTNEFVFKRRRKRLRINVQDVQTVAFLDRTSDIGLHLGLTPEIAAPPELATSSPTSLYLPESSSPGASIENSNFVTVERFLHSSAQAARKTKQRGIGSVTQRRPRAYIRQHLTERRTKPTQKFLKVLKRPKRPARIVKTLFRATVLTDGSPLDTLVDGVGVSHTRRPLKFVPLNKFASSCGLGRADSVEPSDRGRGEAAVSHLRRVGGTSDFKVHHHHRSSSSHSRVPLSLVPFREAEAAYSIMFP